MRRCRLRCWSSAVLMLALVGCGADAGREDAAAAPRDDGVFDAVADTISAQPVELSSELILDESSTPDWTLTEPAVTMSAYPEPGGGMQSHYPTAPNPYSSGWTTSEPAGSMHAFPEPGAGTQFHNPAAPKMAAPVSPVPMPPAPVGGHHGSPAAASTADDWPVITHRSTTSMPTTTTSPQSRQDDRLVVTSVSHVDQIVANLDYGHIVYNAPSTMEFGETRVIEVLLSPTETVVQLKQAMQNTVDVQSAPLQVSNRMEAKLTGSGFDIEPLSEPLQAITSSRPTQWRFKVTPASYGPQELHLTLLAHIGLAGDDPPLVVETKDALIEVNITIGQRVAGFMSANWRWLWAAVVFPVIGMVWRRKTGRDRRYAPV